MRTIDIFAGLGLFTAALVLAGTGCGGCGSDPAGDEIASAAGDAGANRDGGESGVTAGCSKLCGAAELCCSGQCVETKTCDFRISSVEPSSGKLNGGEWITIRGAGFAGVPRVFLGDGRAPARVIDAQTIILQAPPGLAADVDVTISAGASSTIARKAYRYVAAGLKTPWKVIAMQQVRGEDPGITVLQDGRALIAGGTTVPDDPGQALNTLDIFVRKDETVLPQTAQMGAKRWHANAVTLLTGKVLIVGVACETAPCSAGTVADLYDPTTGTVTSTKSPLNKVRSYPRSVLLPDGRVLISSLDDPSLEIYDPDQDRFTLVAHSVLHVRGFMVRLRDGRALLATGTGGNTAAEIFDPDTNVITPTGALIQGREMLTAHTLPDGRVAVIGGASQSAGNIRDPLDTIELYDPKAGTFSLAPYKLTVGRTWHASALVRDGTILAMGGYTARDCNSSAGTVDQIDPVLGTVKAFDALPAGKVSTEWNAVTLLDGSIVAVGGGACGLTRALPEVYFLPGDPSVQ